MSVKKAVIFVPFCLNFTFIINGVINIFSEIETYLVYYERCLSFSNIPPEAKYTNMEELKKRTRISKISKMKIKEFIRSFDVLNTFSNENILMESKLKEPLLKSRI
jgi:hypothetical protein